MKARIAVLAALVIAGCGAPIEERILGEWALDAEATKELESIRNMAEATRRGVLDSLEIRNPRFTFTGETMIFRIADGGRIAERRTDYRVESKDGDRFAIIATGEGGNSQRLDCEFDGATLMITMDGQVAAFKRANR